MVCSVLQTVFSIIVYACIFCSPYVLSSTGGSICPRTHRISSSGPASPSQTTQQEPGNILANLGLACHLNPLTKFSITGVFPIRVGLYTDSNPDPAYYIPIRAPIRIQQPRDQCGPMLIRILISLWRHTKVEILHVTYLENKKNRT